MQSRLTPLSIASDALQTLCYRAISASRSGYGERRAVTSRRQDRGWG
jgi:hypothetical protein